MMINLASFVFICFCCNYVHAIARTSPGCATAEYDILFLLDAAGDVSEQTFAESKEFVKNIIREYDVSPLSTRFSIVTYGSTPKSLNLLENITFFTEDESNFGKKELLDILESANIVGGSRRTGKALNYACDVILGLDDEKIESEVRKRNVPVVIIIVSSGYSQDDISSGLSCKSDKITNGRNRPDITILGVSTNRRGTAIFGSKHIDEVFEANTSSLSMQEQMIISKICSLSAWKCSLAQQDLVFLIDRSDSLSSSDVEHMKQWIKDITNNYVIETNYTRVGLVEFGDPGSISIDFSGLMDSESLQRNIESISHYTHTSEHSERNIEKSLRYVAQHYFNDDGRDSRLVIHRSLILLTTGKFTDSEEGKIVAKDLRLGGVELFIVDVGIEKEDEDLQYFSSKPYSTHITTVQDFSELRSTPKTIVNNICHGMFKRYSGSLLDIHFIIGANANLTARMQTTALMKKITDLFYIGQDYSRIWAITNDGQPVIQMEGVITKGEALHGIDQMSFATTSEINWKDTLLYAHNTYGGGTRDGREKIYIVLSPTRLEDDKFWSKIDQKRKTGAHTYWFGLTPEGMEWQYGETQSGRWDAAAGDVRPVAHNIVDKISTDSATRTTECGYMELDLQFLLDGSSSIKGDDFDQTRDWVKTLISMFEIGKHTTRVGVNQYSGSPDIEFSLNEYGNKASIIQAIDEIQHLKGLTRIGLAINYTTDNSLVPESGARKGVQKVLVVLTDGKSRDTVTEASRIAHSMKDLTTYAIGVSEADQTQLREIASEPKDDHVFQVTDFDQMSSIKNRLATRICETAQKKEIAYRSGQMDLIVMLEDSTLSPTSKYFSAIMSFITKLWVDVVAMYDSKCAFVQFAAHPRTILPFSANVSDLLEAIKSTGGYESESYRSEVNLGLALNHAETMFVTADRTNSKKVLLIIMSNPTSDSSFHEATRLSEAGVYIFGISLGRTASLTQLETIVAKPADEYFYSVPDAFSAAQLGPVLTRRFREVSKIGSCPVLNVGGNDIKRGVNIIDSMNFRENAEDMNLIPRKGSEKNTVAYRFLGRSRVSKPESEVFPNGFPSNVMVISTIRMGKRAVNSEVWHLLELTNAGEKTEFSINVDSDANEIGVFWSSVPPEIAVFRGSEVNKVFNRKWHKLQFLFGSEYVDLYIDCKKVGRQSFRLGDMVLSEEGIIRIGKTFNGRKSGSFDLQRLDVLCGHQKEISDNVETCCNSEEFSLPKCEIANINESRPAIKEEVGPGQGAAGSPDIGVAVEQKECTCDVGSPGPVGPQGPRGLQGERGEIGINGRRGTPGIQGDKGDTGPSGPTGKDASQSGGTIGPRGPPGPPGPPGLSGTVTGVSVRGQKARTQGASDARIEQIAFSTCRSLINTEVPRLVTAMLESSTITSRYRGGRGDKGSQGEIGYDGARGQSGVQGRPGPPGFQGPIGANGPPGPRGSKGDVGERGKSGFGIPGAQGNPGYPGPAGVSVRGQPGQKGQIGTQGIRGPPGHRGIQGAAGIAGHCDSSYCYSTVYKLVSDMWQRNDEEVKG